jgi:DNA-directed RNA polymerase specialized sigma24 family protein
VEIAQETGIPLGTIKSRIAMAMRKLHADLIAGGAGG